MADWTSQPPDGTGVNSIYSGALFLWNGIAPTKNQLNAATATLKGTTQAGGADGQYQHFNNTDGAMSWSITKPSTNYTIVVLHCLPAADVPFAKLVSIPGGNLRFEAQTTGSFRWQLITHTGIGTPASAYSGNDGGAAFNTEMWTYVAAYNGTNVRQYGKRGSGTNETNLSDALTYNNDGSSQIDLGSPDGIAGQGLYACLLLDNDVGDTECQAIRDNGWRIFEPAGGTTSANLINSNLLAGRLLRGLKG